MERKLIDRLLPVLLLILLLVSAALLVRHARWMRERDQEVASLALMRGHQMLGIRLDAMFHEFEEDLLEEREAVRAGSEEAMLLARWNALLRSHWPLLSVRLADERGNELAMHRIDTSIYVVRTLANSLDTVPTAVRYVGASLDTSAFPWTQLGDYDPRVRIWFSKALENDRETPVWNVRQFGDTTEKVLQVSLLAKHARAEEAYQVIMFDVDLDRVDALDGRSAAMLQHGFSLLTAEGVVLFTNAVGREGPIAKALRAAHLRWMESKSERIQTLSAGGAEYIAQVDPLALNGLNLYVNLAMYTDPFADWSRPEHQFRDIAIGLLICFAVLLLLLWLRGRQRRKGNRRMALQLRQSEHRLAKATGEREVLSREVHHRVKNNLQVVSSLLNLQALSLNDEAVREEFLRGKRRIDTIALVHHRLYDHPDLRDIDLQVFLTQLTVSIAGMHADRRNTVSIGVKTDGLKADQDTAIELGIIVCELVTNSFQHAFPHATGGHVEVTVTQVEGDLHRLVVRNNGVAPDQAVLSGPGKLGLEIVEALAEQLDGSLHVHVGPQPTFEVRFRMRRPAGSPEVADAEGL
ncbi:MAG: sensor histidine kinase [Flavobacteriales bacterium]|nr:sensor histidine kinase [Flavobacteriales bacterium]